MRLKMRVGQQSRPYQPVVVVVIYSTQTLNPEVFKENLNILRCERVT